MKRISIYTVILSIVIVLAVALPFNADAAPTMEIGTSVKNFHGKWISVRAGSLQTLKIRCDADTNYCKMEMITEISTSCTNLNGGVPTGRFFEGEGLVEIFDQGITIPAISYCMTEPPTDFHDGPPIAFYYHPVNDTLTDNLGATWYRVDSLKVFEGNWVSVRAGSLQTLKIKCDAYTNYCKMEEIVEISGSCTAQFGEPTGRLWEGGGQVEIIDQTIEIFVDSYCLTEPPTYSLSGYLTFTYHSVDDTLTDNLGATWYRK